MGGLVIPTAHKRNEKGETQYRQKGSVKMGQCKFTGRPYLPLNETRRYFAGSKRLLSLRVLNLTSESRVSLTLYSHFERGDAPLHSGAGGVFEVIWVCIELGLDQKFL
jgi:hypothetical protein